MYDNVCQCVPMCVNVCQCVSVYVIVLFCVSLCVNVCYTSFCSLILLLFLYYFYYYILYRSRSHLFEEFLMTWVDRLKKVKPNIMTLKIQKEVEKYKVKA